MEVQEIVDLIEANGAWFSEVWSEVHYGGYTLEDGTKFNRVAAAGGVGQGDDAWFVFTVNDAPTLFRKTGYYNSFDGFEWDGDLEKVEAFERTITDYRRI